MLGLEMLAIRWISILYYPLAAYIVIALALMGLGLSGGMLALRGGIRPPTAWAAAVFAALFSASSLIAVAFAWAAPASPWMAVGLIAALALPFFFAGLALSSLFASQSTRVSQVYFADLLGAGLGAVATMLALEWIDGVRLGWLLAASGLISAALLSPRRGLRFGFASGAAALTLVAVTAPIPFGITPVAPKELARALQREPSARWESSVWNPLARIDVVSFGDDRLEAELPLEYKLVTQDGGAPTLLIRPDPSLGRLGDRTIFGIPFWIRPQAEVLIIGLGGGPDLLAALEYDPRRVEVVEVNPAMIDLVQNRYADFVGNPLADRRVSVTQGDGRFFVARSSEAYDLIQLTGVDTAVASAAASPNLAENYLYTEEAFRLYYDHLSPDGLLAISFPNVDGLGLRLVNLVTRTLARAGVERPEDHIVVSEITGYIHVLMKRSPLTDEELATLERGFQRRVSSVYFPLYHRLFGDPPQAFIERSAIIASPEIAWPGVYGAYLAAWKDGRQEEFLRSQPQTVEAPVDDHPFIFVLDKWGQRAPNLQALGGLLVALVLASALLLLGPPAVLQRRGVEVSARGALGAFFLAIGLGYILLEVALIQKLSLFLGHPSLALATTIGALLVASALGSLASGNWKGRQKTLLAGSALIVAALAAGMSPLLHLVTDRLLAQPLILRILITIAIVALPGFFMGIPFPTGLAHVKRLVPAFVPWAWGLNATASVSATILALLIALLMGLNAVFLTAALLYAVAAALFVLIARPKQKGERSPHR
jgi:SAM-dependent methyltransferase